MAYEPIRLLRLLSFPALTISNTQTAPIQLGRNVYINLARITAVTQGLIIPQRFTALGPSQVDRLQERLIRYFALKEISSTGTIEAMVGRTIREVQVLDTSRHRHTVKLTLDDGQLIVLFQEPRRRGPNLETVILKYGHLSRPHIRAASSTDLILRFENEDETGYRIECQNVTLNPAELPAASTTHVPVGCPAEPCYLPIRIVGTDQILTIQVG